MDMSCPRCGGERELLLDDHVQTLRCLPCEQEVSFISPEQAERLRAALAAEARV